MRTDDFAYELPADLIAQEPLGERSQARMLVAHPTGDLAHRQVLDLPDLLHRGDLLVLNRTRVIPARLLGRKSTGGRIEVLLVHAEDATASPLTASPQGERWCALVRGSVTVGTVLHFDQVAVTVTRLHADGLRTLEFPPGEPVIALAQRIGHMPLPPYIDRPDEPRDRDRYQTIFAQIPGSVAAPTAGLHLTAEVLEGIRARGVDIGWVDLAIGPGTFKPVDTAEVGDFRIHAERCSCPAETVAAVQACRQRGGRVISIGTTVLRVLETAARQTGGFAPFEGWTSLFLHPPQRLQVVDGLLTNFHMPRSSLLMAVACLTGTQRLFEIYALAIAQRYRFLSYGDCMLVLPERASG